MAQPKRSPRGDGEVQGYAGDDSEAEEAESGELLDAEVGEGDGAGEEDAEGERGEGDEGGDGGERGRDGDDDDDAGDESEGSESDGVDDRGEIEGHREEDGGYEGGSVRAGTTFRLTGIRGQCECSEFRWSFGIWWG